MNDDSKNIISTEEQERKERARFRCLWAFIIFDVVLVVYIVYQILKIAIGF